MLNNEPKVVERKFTGGEAKHQTRAKIARDKADMAFAMRVSEVLQKHYRGHSWRVSVDTRAKIIQVLNLRLSGSWGFVLHMNKILTAEDLDKKVMRAAGELLERYSLSRLGFDPNEYALLKTDDVGDFVIGQ